MPKISFLIAMLLAIASIPSLSVGASRGATRSQDVAIRVDSFIVEPLTLTPGQQLTLRGEYSVMAPDRHVRSVIETVITSYYDEQTQQWKAVLWNTISKMVPPGKHRFSPPLFSPPSQPPGGKFLLTFQVQVALSDVSDQKSQEVRAGSPPELPPDQGAPPVVVLSSPAEGQQVTTVQLPVSGTATGMQRIVRVDIQINGELLRSRSTPAGQNTVDFSEQVSLRPGTNEIVVTAVDQRNQSAHQRVTVTRIEEPRSPRAEPEPAPEGGGKRVALVIGNGRYPEAPLSNPTNDAQDMAAALRELGFAVIVGEDLTKPAMVEAIRAFGKQSQKGDVGLFYFAGHGIQVNGINYLIPIGAQIDKEQDVEFEAVHVDRVLAEMEAAENNLNIVILDACRDNPLPRRFRRITRGLAPVDAPRGTLIAFATAPGKTASDGDGRNGLYTGAWLQYIRMPGLRIEDVLYGVQNVVEEKSGGKQIPWSHSSLKRVFYFKR